ncbi:glycine cleavage system protein GcvH [bacterium]|nr:MAG: glycine cleavage system protein GcvH [bacterium]
MAKVPDELKYTTSHEWVRLADGIATIGITDHAQSELGDVVFVELPEVGRKLSKGESFGSVESVKTVSDIYAPVAGEVVAVNEAIAGDSSVVNTDPYGGGFLIQIRPDGELDADLLDASAYSAATA